jgi:methyl acetate hydrolase
VPSTSALDDLLEASTSSLAGVVALVTTPTEVVYEGAFGVRSAARKDAMTVDTTFALASMTKPLVSVAAMQLVERGALDLHAPIASLLPELGPPMVLERLDDDGAPVLRPATGAVTVHHLLTHTAGYGYGFWSDELRSLHARRDVGQVPASWQELSAEPLLFEPGSRWCYGVNTDVLGKVIEAVAGVPLDAYLDEHVLGPMGMRDTTVTFDDGQRARAAAIHYRTADGTLVALEDPLDGERSFSMGGGALCGTAPDYARFLQMTLRSGELDGTRVLEPASVTAMATNQLDGPVVTTLVTAMPDVSNDVDLLVDTPVTWGLGYLINTERGPDGRNAGSLAWAGLFNTYFWVDPVAGLGGVLMTQVLPFCDRPALELLGRFERAVYRP